MTRCRAPCCHPPQASPNTDLTRCPHAWRCPKGVLSQQESQAHCSVCCRGNKIHTRAPRHPPKHPHSSTHREIKTASPNCQNVKLKHRWFLVKGPEPAPCSALLLGPCSICRSHPAFALPMDPHPACRSKPCLVPPTRPTPAPRAQPSPLSHPCLQVPALSLGLISTRHSTWPCPWSDLEPRLCPWLLHPGPGPQLHAHPRLLSCPKTPPPRPPLLQSLHKGQRLWKEKQPQGEERHVWMALGTGPPAPSASPFERPRQLPQRRGLGEREPLTPLGKCWVASGARGGDEGGSNSSA